MLVVLEGLPGAGKTTVLRELGQLEGVNMIDEIPGGEPPDAGLDFYLQNDERKHDLIVPGAVNLMDRNYVSTLCYNYCSDQQHGTDNYEAVVKATDAGIAEGRLQLPNLYVVLTCAVETSLARQNRTNAPTWQQERFLRQVHGFYAGYFALRGEVVTVDTDEADAAQTAENVKQAIATKAKSMISASREGE